MTQLVAMEGGCFGLVCCQVVSVAGAEKMKLTGFPWFEFPGGGFSTVSIYSRVRIDIVDMSSDSPFDMCRSTVPMAQLLRSL